MNPLTRVLAYAVAILIVTQGLTAWWLDHDERALGAVPAQIQAARVEDAKAADDAVLNAIQAQVVIDQTDRDQAVKAQARADAAHEQTVLGIQRRQDLATIYFGDANHDPLARSWAAQPVPLSYLLGMCAVLGDNARGCGAAAGSKLDSSGPSRGPGADGGDEPARHQHHR